MNPLFGLTSIAVQDLQNLIDNAIEESAYLEFKAAGSLDKAPDKKREISKDVSAFANSGGGTIIYGMSEVDHKAHSFSYIDGNTYTKEWLEQVINSKIHRRVDNIAINPIRVEGKIEQSIYVVHIPESAGMPHMADDQVYYKRYNYQVLKMEEYEVRQAYSRQAKTELSIEPTLFSYAGGMMGGGTLVNAAFLLTFQARNVGSSIENQYKMEIAIPENAHKLNNGHSNPIKDYKIRDEEGYAIFSVPNKSPLFQDELTTVIQARVTIHKFAGLEEIKAKPVKLKLYYSNGVKQAEVDLRAVLKYENKFLYEHSFER